MLARTGWLAVLLVCACRTTTSLGSVEFEGAALFGMRDQPGWANSTAPVMRFDGAVRPCSWPVGVKASTALTGYFGDATGEQSLDLGLGLTSSFELVPDLLSGSVGVGHLFVTTDNGALFGYAHDDWEADYVEAGLYLLLAPSDGLSLGLEMRYSTGDGPLLGMTQRDGDFMDLFLVAGFGLTGGSAAPVAH